MSVLTPPPSSTDRRTGPRRDGILAGTATLLRLILRRDRLRLAVWVIGVTGFVVGSAIGFLDVVPTAAARASRAELMSSPTIKALRGPGYGLDDYSYGTMIAHELLLFAALAVALMSVLLVVRHTRAEEETGRTELVRATVVGRHAATAAAVIAAVAANLLIAIALAVVLPAAIQDLELVGSVAFGAAVAAVGIVFATVGAVTAQLTEHARGATGLAAVVLAATFVLRALGDVGGPGDRALSWLSPLGWAQSTRPFVDERWWPLALCALVAAVLVATAFALTTRRDVATGVLPPRPGPATASMRLTRPLGLAWRLHRMALTGWIVGLGLTGLSFGVIVGDIETFLDDNPHLEDILGTIEGGTLLDSFLATVVLILALMATGYGLQAVARLRSEETDGRAEPLLASALPRTSWVASHLTVALVGSGGVLLAGTAGLGVTASIDQGDTRLLGEVVAAGLVRLPALWLTIAVVVAAFGLAPRASQLGWVLLAYATFIGLLGAPLDLPAMTRALSPFDHLPALPGGEFTVAPVVALLAATALFVVVGFASFRRRGVNVT